MICFLPLTLIFIIINEYFLDCKLNYRYFAYLNLTMLEMYERNWMVKVLLIFY